MAVGFFPKELLGLRIPHNRYICLTLSVCYICVRVCLRQDVRRLGIG